MALITLRTLSMTARNAPKWALSSLEAVLAMNYWPLMENHLWRLVDVPPGSPSTLSNVTLARYCTWVRLDGA